MIEQAEHGHLVISDELWAIIEDQRKEREWWERLARLVAKHNAEKLDRAFMEGGPESEGMA